MMDGEKRSLEVDESGKVLCPVQIGQRGSVAILCHGTVEEVTTYGGRTFALICKTRGHILPVLTEEPSASHKRCGECGCKSGHATGCPQPQRLRQGELGMHLMVKAAAAADPDRSPIAHDCFEQMEIWADSISARTCEPLIQVQLWYEWYLRSLPIENWS